MAEKVNLRPAPIKVGSNTSISNSFHPRPLQSIQPNLYPLMAKVVRNSLKKNPCLLTLLSNSCEWQWWWQWWQWWWRWRWWWQWCLSFNLLRLTFEGNSTAGSHTEPSILQNHLYFMAALILSSAVLKKRNTNKHNVVKIKSCIGSCVMMMRNTETDDVTAFSVPRRELPNYWPRAFQGNDSSPYQCNCLQKKVFFL